MTHPFLLPTWPWPNWASWRVRIPSDGQHFFSACAGNQTQHVMDFFDPLSMFVVWLHDKCIYSFISFHILLHVHVSMYHTYACAHSMACSMISVIQVSKKIGEHLFKAANPRVQKLLLRIFPWQNWWMFWINTEKYDKFMINHLSLHQPSHWSNSVHICQSYSFTKSLVQLPCFLTVLQWLGSTTHGSCGAWKWSVSKSFSRKWVTLSVNGNFRILKWRYLPYI